MKPPFAHLGLDRFLEAVPLPLPLPPGPAEGWTCLLCVLGPSLALGTSQRRWKTSDRLLTALLEIAGRPTAPDESRALRLVTPIPAHHTALELLTSALARDEAAAAACALGWLGDDRTLPALEGCLNHPRSEVQEQGVLALARLGAPDHAIGTWDGETDEERLLARVQLGVPVLPLPASLGELSAVFGQHPDIEAVEDVRHHGRVVQEAVATYLSRHPERAADLGEWLGGELPQVPEQLVWADAIAAAGEETREAVLAACGAADWRARMGAAVTLGKMPGARSEAALRGLLRDEDSDVRREAALALQPIDPGVQIPEYTVAYDFLDRAATSPLGAALAGGEVPLSLVAMLAHRGEAEVMVAVVLLLALAHPDEMAESLEALALDDRCDVPLEARQAAAAGLLLGGRAPRERQVVFRLLLRGVGAVIPTGDLEGVRPEDVAAVAAKDSDWTVRLAALGLLDRLGVGDRYDALLATLAATDSQREVRVRAQGMRSQGFTTPGLGTGLAKLVVGDPYDDGSRMIGLAQVARHSPELADPIAVALLSSHDRECAVMAARIAGRGVTNAALSERIQLALGMLQSHDWIAREAGAALLGSLPQARLDSGLGEELVEALESAAAEDSDPDVRRMARWAASGLTAMAELAEAVNPDQEGG